MDIMKKTKIEQYLQRPLWVLLILVFIDVEFFFLDIRCAVILAVVIIAFAIFQMVIYSRSKQAIVKECMNFMFERVRCRIICFSSFQCHMLCLMGMG